MKHSDFFIVVAILVIVAIGIGLYFYFKKSGKHESFVCLPRSLYENFVCSGTPFYCKQVTNQQQCQAYPACSWGGGGASSGGGGSISNGGGASSVGGGGASAGAGAGAGGGGATGSPSGGGGGATGSPSAGGGGSTGSPSAPVTPGHIPSVIKGIYVTMYGGPYEWNDIAKMTPSNPLSYLNTIIWWPGNNPEQGITTISQAPNGGKTMKCLLNNGKLNIFCLGGGPTTWDSATLSSFPKYIEIIKNAGFQGLGFDIEQGTASFADFDPVFKKIKAAGLICYVTTSWCKGLGANKGEAFMKSLLASSDVDILSMQFYAGGTKCNTASSVGSAAQSVDSCTTNFGSLAKSAKPKLAASIANYPACTQSFETIWENEYKKDPNTSPFTGDGFVIWYSAGGKGLPKLCKNPPT